MRRRDWANWIGRAVLEMGIGLLFLFCAMAYGQAPFVNLTGQMTGPNGLPVANNVITFKPTQMFFVGGTNTTQQVGNLFGNSAPTGTCLIQAQLYTETGVTPQLLYQCQYGAWVLVSGAGGSGCLGGNSIANGCTGATTVPVADQNLNVPTPCAAQVYLVGSTIYDCMDYADGTNINGLTAQSGNSQWFVGGNGAVITDQHLFATGGPGVGNYYATLPNTTTVGGTPQPITTIGGTFVLCPNDDGNAYDPLETGVTILASKDGSITNGFMHFEISPSGWVLRDTLTNTGGLYVVVGSTVPTHLVPDCKTEYAASVIIDQVHNTVQVIPPEGPASVVTTDANISTINAKYGEWQTQNDVGVGAAVGGWGSVWMGGPSQASKYSANQASRTSIAALGGNRGTNQWNYPDGSGNQITIAAPSAGCYEIAHEFPLSGFLLDETVDLTASISSGNQHLKFYGWTANGTAASDMLLTQTYNVGSPIINSAVISNDGGGNERLDICVNSSYTASPVTLTVRGMGMFESYNLFTATAPAPLTNAKTTTFSTTTLPALLATLQAGTGWQTVLTENDLTANHPLDGDFHFTVYDGTNSEILHVVTSGYSNVSGTCAIATADGMANGTTPNIPIDQVRCSWDVSAKQVHLDFHTATAFATLLTANLGTSTGAWALFPTPATGAVALADGNDTKTFVLPGAASPNGSYQFNLNGAIGSNPYVLDASSFSGSDGGAKITNCFTSLSGYGTCDATSLGDFSSAASITIPSGDTLLVCSHVTMANQMQIVPSQYALLTGCNRNIAIIQGHVTNGGVVSPSGGNATYSQLTIETTDSSDTTAYGLDATSQNSQTLDQVTFIGGYYPLHLNGSYYDQFTNLVFIGTPQAAMWAGNANSLYVDNFVAIDNGSYCFDLENTQGFTINHIDCENTTVSAALFGNSSDGPVSGTLNGGYVQVAGGADDVTFGGAYLAGSSVVANGVWWFTGLGCTGDCTYMTNNGGLLPSASGSSAPVSTYTSTIGGGTTYYTINIPNTPGAGTAAGWQLTAGTGHTFQISSDYSGTQWDFLPEDGSPVYLGGTFYAVTQSPGDNTKALATDEFVQNAVTGGAYTLPIATGTVLGGVKAD